MSSGADPNNTGDSTTPPSTPTGQRTSPTSPPRSPSPLSLPRLDSEHMPWETGSRNIPEFGAPQYVGVLGEPQRSAYEPRSREAYLNHPFGGPLRPDDTQGPQTRGVKRDSTGARLNDGDGPPRRPQPGRVAERSLRARVLLRAANAAFSPRSGPSRAPETPANVRNEGDTNMEDSGEGEDADDDDVDMDDA